MILGDASTHISHFLGKVFSPHPETKSFCMETWSGVEVQPQRNGNFYPHLSFQTVFPALNLHCYIRTIGSPTQHIYCAWKTIRTIWQNMKAREKIPISQMLSELGKTWKCSQFLLSSVNWEKLTIAPRTTFKIFYLFVNWEKHGSTTWVQKSSLKFESIDELGKVMSQFKFYCWKIRWKI